MGVKKGDRVGVHLPNCPQYIIAYYASLTIGAIVVNINPLYTPSELKHIFDNTGMTTLVTGDVSLEAVRALCKQVEIPRVIVTSIYDYGGGQRQEKPAKLEKLHLFYGRNRGRALDTELIEVFGNHLDGRS